MHTYKKTSLFYLCAAFVLVIGAVLAFVLNLRGMLYTRPQEFSKDHMLQALWYQYKHNYLEEGTLRSLDKDRDNITTSEGQSYTMLRSVWLDDKETFDGAWQWTKDNLQRNEDHLISWLFGQRNDGTYDVLSDRGGYNTATDADVDIALALLLASKRWNDETYFGDAIVMIRDIWSKEVITVGGKPYLLANNIEKSERKSYGITNPSYFSPYAYKLFAKVDPSHDWLGVASTSYEVALRSMESPLDKEGSVGLPPDWIGIDKKTGALVTVDSGYGLSTDYSFDAMRLPWRFGVDYEWTKDPRAREVLDKLSFLSSEWNKKHSIVTAYSHNGDRLSQDESTGMYGASLGYFMAVDPKSAYRIYRSKLESLYDYDETKWRTLQSYYDDNWAWFGMALYAGEIRDFSLLRP